MTDLAEAVPVQAVATQNDRRVVRRPIAYTAQLDVLQLIVRFLIRARDGAPFSFTTFKDTWKRIGFSHVFQAGPSSRTGLPFLISSLYNFLLYIIKAGSLPLREVFELANPFSTLNQQSLTNIASNGHLPALTPENVSWATAPIVQGPPVVATAVYCLYSIYYAQPGPLTVKIRVSKQHQETIKHLTTYLAESNALDALSLLTQLVKDKALLPGSSQESDTSLTNININRTTTVPPAAPGAAARLDSGSGGLGGAGGGGGHSTIPASTLAPGMGALYVVPGLRGKDAATLREVHFHLDSTLTGLGTAHLDPLCRGYGRKLKELWSALGQCELEKEEIIQDKGPAETLRGRGGRGGANGKKRGTRVAKKSSVKVTAPAPAAPAVAAGVSSVAASEQQQQQQQQQPEGIADLSMGKYLHEYATTKREELQLTLQYGPKWREKLKKKEQESDKTTAAAGPPPSSAARKRGPRSRKKGDASLSIPGVPGVSRQLLAREKARHIDIARRSQPWAQRMGVDNVVEKEIQAVAAPYTGMMGDSDEDMPLLPGLPSEYEYLAGPSDMAGTGGGPGSTKLTNTTIQGKKGRKKKDGSSSGSSDGSTSSSSSSSSSSSDSSSSDESDSDGEEVEMEVMAGERGRGSGARGGRGKASAAAVAGRGRGGRGSVGIARASAVSVGSGMRGGKKEKGTKAVRGTKRGAEAAAAAEDVQNLLSEIDMALAEDARIQI